MIASFNSFLSKEVKNKLFIPYLFSIGHYILSNSSHAKSNRNQILEYRMSQGKMKNHDPLVLVPKHCTTVGIQWTYPHQTFQEESMYQGIESLVHVFQKRQTSSKEGIWDSI